MDRTRLRNMFLQTRSNGNKEAYNKQRNYCFSITRKTKQEYYNNLDQSFWKYIKPLFCDLN